MVSTGMGKEKMGSLKKLAFKGNHPALVDGKFYTYEDYASVANVGYKCMYSRLYGKNIVTDNELRPLKSKHIGKAWNPNWNPETDKTWSRFETAVDQLSQKWLSKIL